ncbi:glycosyltransferase [Desulfuromonas acetexigens]|uniref:UDP glycosyltransferase n=1 Tax=Trichloromonas acetexigens TaxID=38815 RepID=A0A550JJI3_9BACT|nr:nucleotide disphospho-sugar-binding domain-containing protein [Desulfuromonas acetexigens]TRO83333.1 UDP glycosyltransferase [Desulfuromonas acetexigens]
MRILCLPYTHTLSHISRPLAIAAELRARGHDIIFAGDSPKDHFIRSEGFDVLPAYQVEPDILFNRIRQGKLQFVSDDELYRLIASDRDLYRQVQPDLVLSDGRFSAPLSAGLDGIPQAAIVNVSSTEYRALPYIPFFEWLPEKLVKRDGSLGKSLDRFNLALEMLVFDNAATVFKKLSRKFGLRRTVTATNCLAGNDLTLLADIPEYFPTRNLPADYHYIGPLTWQSPLPPPAWWPPKNDGKRLVYFTMGTTWMGGSFTTLYKRLQQEGLTAIIATGGQAQGLETIEGEVYVEEFVDGDLVMAACDLVVCHGGNGTIYQALQHGKPIVGIPTIPDQQFNMRRVKALGVGEALAPKTFADHPEKLFALARQVAEDSRYRDHAKRLQGQLASLAPAKKAADLIEARFGRN